MSASNKLHLVENTREPLTGAFLPLAQRHQLGKERKRRSHSNILTLHLNPVPHSVCTHLLAALSAPSGHKAAYVPAALIFPHPITYILVSSTHTDIITCIASILSYISHPAVTSSESRTPPSFFHSKFKIRFVFPFSCHFHLYSVSGFGDIRYRACTRAHNSHIL